MSRINSYLLFFVLSLVLSQSSLVSAKAERLTPFAASDALPEKDDVWLVNARRCGLSCSTKEGISLGVEQYVDGCRWESRSIDELLLPSSQPNGTVIFVHGNRVSAGTARLEGLQVYRTLRAQSGGSGGFRIVIFSWPSEKIGRRLKDVRVKAARTTAAAYQLGELLSQLPAEEPVGLMGYSFGARIITGSLQLLSGGRIGSYWLSDGQQNPRAPYRVVLVASALHSHWLDAGQCHGLAITQMDRLLLIKNSCDKALKHYPLIERHSNPAALGYVGLNQRCLLPHAATIQQIDACRMVGRSHSLGNYLYSSHWLMNRVWNGLQVVSVSQEPIPAASDEPGGE